MKSKPLEILLMIIVVLLFFMSWVVMEYGPSLLVIPMIGLAVWLVYREKNKNPKSKEIIRACHCELCDYVRVYGWPTRVETKVETIYLTVDLKEDDRVTDYKKFLDQLDRQD